MYALTLALFEKNESTQHGVSVRYMPIHHTILKDTLNTLFSMKQRKEDFTILFLPFSF